MPRLVIFVRLTTILTPCIQQSCRSQSYWRRRLKRIHPAFTRSRKMEEIVIVSAVRTPVGKFQGSLSGFSAVQLGSLVIREAVARAGVEAASIDECIMGNVVSAGLGQNPARQAALKGGLPPEVSAMTINKVCG